MTLTEFYTALAQVAPQFSWAVGGVGPVQNIIRGFSSSRPGVEFCPLQALYVAWHPGCTTGPEAEECAVAFGLSPDETEALIWAADGETPGYEDMHTAMLAACGLQALPRRKGQV